MLVAVLYYMYMYVPLLQPPTASYISHDTVGKLLHFPQLNSFERETPANKMSECIL